MVKTTFGQIKKGSFLYGYSITNGIIYLYKYKVIEKGTTNTIRSHDKFGGKKTTTINFTIELVEYMNKPASPRTPITYIFNSHSYIQTVPWNNTEYLYSDKQMFDQSMKTMISLMNQNIENINQIINN